MKKISGSIAMLLVLVMLACSFTGCLSYVYKSSSTGMRILYAIVDIVFLPISLLALLIYVIINDASGEMDAQMYLSSVDNNILSEYYNLGEKINSLPDTELASLKAILNSLPETDRVISLDKMKALSETRLFSLVNAFNSLPEAEILSSIDRISALSETEVVSLLQDFNALSEAELDSVIEELNSLHPEYVAMDYIREEAGFSIQ